MHHECKRDGMARKYRISMGPPHESLNHLHLTGWPSWYKDECFNGV
jgi:hypothetical protein